MSHTNLEPYTEPYFQQKRWKYLENANVVVSGWPFSVAMRPWDILYMMYKYQATYFGSVDLCPLDFIFSCKIIPIAYPEVSLNSGLCSDLCRESSGWVLALLFVVGVLLLHFASPLFHPTFTSIPTLFHPYFDLILVPFQPLPLSLSPPSSFPLSTPRPSSLSQYPIHSFGHLLKLSLCT